MSKEWRIIQTHFPMAEHSSWVVSRKKLSDEEVESLWERSSYTYDFFDELGIEGGGHMLFGIKTMYGATKSVAEEECLKLNNGKSLFEEFYEKRTVNE